MLKTLNNNTNRLVETLQKSDIGERTVVYYGFAEVAASAILANNDFNTKDQGFKISKVCKEVTDIVGEYAVLDRAQFEKTLRNVLTYNVVKSTTVITIPDINTFQSFGDALGFSKYYSAPDIALIDGNMELYKQAMSATHFGMSSLLEEYL